MSVKRIWIVAGTCFLGWIGYQVALQAGPAGTAEAARTPALQKFMRVKLSLTQGVLEGLVLEDFDRINRNSNALLLLTAAAEWKQKDTPLYSQHSAEFRAAVKELREASQKQNLEGAALAYLHLTSSCVECHRYVRSTLIAK